MPEKNTGGSENETKFVLRSDKLEETDTLKGLKPEEAKAPINLTNPAAAHPGLDTGQEPEAAEELIQELEPAELPKAPSVKATMAGSDPNDENNGDITNYSARKHPEAAKRSRVDSVSSDEDSDTDADLDPDATVLSARKGTNPDPTKSAAKGKPFVYSDAESPNSTALLRATLTRERGKRALIWQWRMESMTAKDFMQFKVPNLEKRLSLANDTAQLYGIDLNQKVQALALVKNYMAHGHSAKEIYDQLIHINDKLPKYLMHLLKIEFAQDTPNSMLELPEFVSNLSDLSFSQFLDDHKLENSRILHQLNSTIFYHNTAIQREADNSGFKMVKTDDHGNVSTLYSVKVEHNDAKTNKMHKVKFVLEDESSEGVIALADFMSMHRQGNTNTIKLATIGDPVGFTLLWEELLAVHKMHVVVEPRVLNELLNELNGLTAHGYGQDQIDKLINRVNDLNKYTTVISPYTNLKLNPFVAKDTSTSARLDIFAKLDALVANRKNIYETPASAAPGATPPPAGRPPSHI